MTKLQLNPESARSPQLRALAAGLTPAPSADTSDLALVRRAQLGERGVFDLLVIKYQRRIFKLVMRYTRNPADAEDASQEAFIKAYRGLRRFRGECAFYTWLHRIAINCAKNVLAARARDPTASTFVVPDGDEAAELPVRLRDVETPEDLALAEDIRGMVNVALATLPEAHRTAIMCREIDGLTYEEIAVAMGTPLGTVRSRVYRAREAIDDQLRLVFDGGIGRERRRRSRPTAAAK
jgi:RNA polymerase sigma-70 factor (ECF subfamily)